MIYTKEHKEQIAAEVLDSEKVQLRCSQHNYLGGKIPPRTSGCKNCWMAYYTWDLATTPPSLRQERLEELESVIMHAVEFQNTGRFGKDLELYAPGDPRFKVEITDED
jgi:hypothetical protein